MIRGHFDTKNAGNKLDPASYKKIASDLQVSPDTILFFSDHPRECFSAKNAGMQAIQICRPGNEAITESVRFTAARSVERITDFYELSLMDI